MVSGASSNAQFSRSGESSLAGAAVAAATTSVVSLLSGLNLGAMLAEGSPSLRNSTEIPVTGNEKVRDVAAGNQTGAASQAGSAKGDKPPDDDSSVSSDTRNSAPNMGPNAAAGATGEHLQTDPAPAAAAMANPSEAATMQPVPVHVILAQPAAESGERISPQAAGQAPIRPAETGDSLPASGINSAKLIQTLSETQMHVGMRSAEFGDISIRTSVSQQQMLAQITVDHGDLGRALALHALVAQSKLGEDLGLHASIEVTQSGSSYSGERGASPQQQQQNLTPPPDADYNVASSEVEAVSLRAAASAETTDRLDIRA